LPGEGNYGDGDLEYDYDNDGDLGYYPDGVRRTLTDAQIEIFRWSEIQSLLKAKRQEFSGLEEGGKRQTLSKYPSVDGSGEGLRRIPRSMKRERAELRGPFGESAAKRIAYDADTVGERSTLNYDDIPHPPSQVSTEDFSPEAEAGENEEEYEMFLAKEREEIGANASDCRTDPDTEGVVSRGPGVDSISVADTESVEHSTSNPTVTPITVDKAVPSCDDTTQPVHSRRRIFYGDDDDDNNTFNSGCNSPNSTAPTTVVAAGGVTKGEKRAFLWPKIGG
jgi:hypothetical protein